VKVFISWSGPRSKEVASVLKATLPDILAGSVETFISSEDIHKGERGLAVIAKELNDTDYGIVVLTRSNVNAQWINFESGALGRSLGASHVSPLLVDLSQKDVTGPLTQFQMTDAQSEDDVLKLFQDINSACERPIPVNAVSTLFTAHWPTLEQVISKSTEPDEADAPARSSDDLLEEILERVRGLDRSASVGRPDWERVPAINLLTRLIGRQHILHTSTSSIEDELLEVEVTLTPGSPQLSPDALARIGASAKALNCTITLARDDSWIQFSPEGRETRSAS
jgi:hypothetical protein